MLEVTPTRLPEVLVLKPRAFADERGFFMESWNQKRFDDAMGQPVRFVQDNHSRSIKGVLRGLHYQVAPAAQGKLVRAASGRIFDVAVDLRRSSPRLGQWVGVELSAENGLQLWVPAGFAHGFLTLSDSADVLYKSTDFYSPQHERMLAWDDPHMAIDWPLGGLGTPVSLSPKDAQAARWAQAELFAE
jgi:dTDP-4-dehydrorhamnose 3,5-epimerase